MKQSLSTFRSYIFVFFCDALYSVFCFILLYIITVQLLDIIGFQLQVRFEDSAVLEQCNLT